MKCGNACGLHSLAFWLLVIGGLNWGLVGAFDLDVVNMIFGAWDWLEMLIQILIGLSGILILLKGSCKSCKK